MVLYFRWTVFLLARTRSYPSGTGKTMVLTDNEVSWIISKLSIYFLDQEIREVLRFLSAKKKEDEKTDTKPDRV